MGRRLKFVLIGYDTVGKTSLHSVCTTNYFPMDYKPTMDGYGLTKVTVNETEYVVRMWDAIGRECPVYIRQLSYPKTDVFLPCFSITDQTTFENIGTKWADEFKQPSKCPALLLVGHLREAASFASHLDISKTQTSPTRSYSHLPRRSRKGKLLQFGTAKERRSDNIFRKHPTVVVHRREKPSAHTASN
jgi:small GTP-binding protein